MEPHRAGHQRSWPREAQSIQDVSLAIAQVDQTTQQNAALVEQSDAAAESLRHQAARMIEVVRQF